MSGGPENGCVGRVYDLDGAVRVAPDDGRMRPKYVELKKLQ